MSAFVKRARALVGCRFRAQGRDPSLGLDCVGLACAAYRIPAEQIPGDYRMRGDHRRALDAGLRQYFRTVRIAKPGDLAVLQAGADQLHLAVMTERGFIHAHAGLRRVVETPGMPPWQVLSIHRRRRPVRS